LNKLTILAKIYSGLYLIKNKINKMRD